MNNGKQIFYVTDGTNNIHTVDPSTWKVLATNGIFYKNGQSAKNLNDLSVIGERIYSMVFLTSNLLVINKHTFEVDKVLDLTELSEEVNYELYTVRGLVRDNNFCLNGITFDQENDIVLITGKKWPWVY